MAKKHRLRINIGQALDVGIKRRESPNQDAIGVFMPAFLSKRLPLFVVADGMGGHQEGARAAQYIIQSLQAVHKKAARDAHPSEILSAGITLAHKRILKFVKRHRKIHKMGAAMAAAIIQGEEIYFANVGDVRIYLINSNEIRQISMDQSFVGEQLRQGIITADELQKHPRRNVLTMSVTSSREDVEPHTGQVDYESGDYLLLCSDGLWGTVSENQLQDVVLELDPQAAADKLVSMANMNQGPDNISVIIANIV